MEIVAACDDVDSLLAAIERERPDVVVTDIRMPPTGTDEGIQVAARLRETHPDIGVVVLSQYAEPSYVLDLLDSGSDGRGYLLKERVHHRSELLAAIDSVASGGSVIDPKIVDVLVAAKARAEHSPLSQLTGREREVLAEIAAGKSNTAIAESLVLTKRAVEKHINSIFMKLGLAASDDVSKRVKATLLFLAEAEPRDAGRPGRLASPRHTGTRHCDGRAPRLGIHMRRVLPSVLVVLATLLAFLAIFALWANRQLLDTDNWTETSTSVLENQDVQEQLSIFLVDELYTNVDVQARIQEALPPRADVLAGPAAGGLKGLLEDAVDALLDRPLAQDAWEKANRAAHERFLQIVEDEGEAVSTAGGDVVLDLKVLLQQTEERAGIGGRLEEKIPEGAAQLTIMKSDELELAQDIVGAMKAIAVVLLILAFGLFALADLPGSGPAPGNPAGMRHRVHRGRRGCAPGAIARGGLRRRGARQDGVREARRGGDVGHRDVPARGGRDRDHPLRRRLRVRRLDRRAHCLGRQSAPLPGAVSPRAALRLRCVRRDRVRADRMGAHARPAKAALGADSARTAGWGRGGVAPADRPRAPGRQSRRLDAGRFERLTVARRPGRTTLALALPILVFVLFGMARVVAPASALGLVFDQPLVFAAVAVVLSVAGAALLFVRPVELRMAAVLAGETAELSAAEAARLGKLLREVGERAGIDTDRLIVRVQDDPEVNASAGAAHLLFVTTGALALPDEELEGVLAHELGHHRGLHPVLTAVVWWLRLPGAVLAGVYRVLRRSWARSPAGWARSDACSRSPCCCSSWSGR